MSTTDPADVIDSIVAGLDGDYADDLDGYFEGRTVEDDAGVSVGQVTFKAVDSSGSTLHFEVRQVEAFVE